MKLEKNINILQSDQMPAHMDLLYENKQQMPEAVEWALSRYKMPLNSNIDESGELSYTYSNSKLGQKSLDLKFCISGNKYCPKDCNNCCKHEVETVDVFRFKFSPFFLKRLVSASSPTTKKEKILSFKYNKAFTQPLQLTKQHRTILEGLVGENNYTGNTIENIFVYAKMNELLHYSMTTIPEDMPETLTCPFLSEANGINKIYDARDILLQRLDSPITIKDLARKVAINECYLKKGFKEIFGTTIFDYYQNKRMEHAKFLLYDKGLSVTDAADILGYSSISHFSTAFKKFTGIKPCELLLHPQNG